MNISDFLSEPVTSKDNPSIKLFRKLMTSKKDRMQYKRFALEGSRLVFDALKSNAPVKKIFVTQSALGKYGDYLQNVECPNINLILISVEFNL